MNSAPSIRGLPAPSSTVATSSSRIVGRGGGFLLICQLAVGGACASGSRDVTGSGDAGASGHAGHEAGAGGTGAAGIAGAGGAAGKSGMEGGAGAGAGTTGSSGGTAATGTGGSAGSGGSAMGGSNVTPGDAKAAAMVLDGLTLIKPCNDGVWGCCCSEDPKYENQHIVKMFGGDPSVTYNVKLRIAGVSERYWYTGGTLDSASKLFYTGGLPTIHMPPQAPNTLVTQGGTAAVGSDSSPCKIHAPETDGKYALGFTVPPEVRPADGCYNGFNIFAMAVSSPKKSYYLNYTQDFDGSDRQPHACYTNDYTVTIPISGQAQLDFYVIDGDHHQVANTGNQMVPNVKTKQPYHGNFWEFTVVDVTTAPAQ